LLASLVCNGADAAATRRFAIPAEPASAALIDFALQSNISIGGDTRCEGRSAPLEGTFAIEAGLARLLAPTSCSFRIVAPDTVRIVPRTRTVAVAPPTAAPQPRPVAVSVADVIVTATKRRALADELPYAISQVDSDALAEEGAVDASDIAAGQAGVATTNLGPGRDKLLLRGLSDGSFTGHTQSTVGLYLDDTPITYNAPDPDLRLTDIDSVELLRGPQGSLYGSGSMSGVYRIITRKPQLNVFSGEALLGGGVTQGGAPSSEAEAILNLPLAHDEAALRLVGYYERDGGYIDDSALRAKNVDTSTRSGGRAAVRLLAGSDWTLTAGGAYQIIHTDDTQYVTSFFGRLNKSNVVLESSGNSFVQGYMRLERDSAQTVFHSSTSYVHRDIASLTDASNALSIFGAAHAAVGVYDEPISINSLVEEAELTSPNIGRWRWLIGAYGALTREDTHATVSSGALPNGLNLMLYDERRKDTLDEGAIYGETSFALTSRLGVTAGFRFSDTAVDTTSLRSAPQRGVEKAFRGAATFDGASPKIAFDYQLSPSSRVYALVSEGRRAGGFNTGAPLSTVFQPDLPAAPGGGPAGGPGSVPGMTGVPRRFEPDELWNYEAGLKTSLFGGRLALTSAAYYNDWRNIQTDQVEPSGLLYTANAGDGRNIGLEAEIAWRPLPRLLLEANALADDPELTKPSPGFTKSSLPGVPDLTVGARTTYRWSIGPSLEALVGAEAQYIGRSHATFNPMLSPVMGGYVLDKLSGQIQGKGWRLAAYLENPTGERGNTFSYGNPFTIGQLAAVTPQRPRTLRLTLSAGF
jgi:outer membrane receptor protein involved in Fe transport